MPPYRHGNAIGPLWMVGLVGLSWLPARVTAERGKTEGGLVPAEEPSGPDFDLHAELAGAYTSNLYHVTRRHLSEFETRNAPGDRFHDMNGPEDFLLVPALEAALGWDVGDKRDAEVFVEAAYVAHVRNSIANYVRLKAAGTYELGRDDALSLTAKLVPTRFKKNYPVQEVLDTTIYARADYLEVGAALAYEHDFGKHWSSEVAYGFQTQGYEQPFHNRNSDEHALALLAAVELGSRVELGGGLRAAVASAPGDLEFGVKVDRSHYDLEPIATFELDLPSHFDIELRGSYRVRNYTTDVEADDTYFERDDRKLDVGLEVSKRFWKNWTVRAESSWTHNDADRIDAQTEPDDVDYDELVVGAAVEAALQ